MTGTGDPTDSAPVTWAARAGLTARGLVYLLVGLLAVLVARGGEAHLDQRGALAQVLNKPLGPWVVGGMAGGFAAYAVWRLSEAAFGVTGQGRKKGPRLQSLVRGLVYGFLSYSAVKLLQGSREAQGNQQRDYAASVMAHSGGRWLVGLVGAIVVAVGLFMVYEGATAKFMRYFPAGGMAPAVRKVLRVLGAVGSIARGLVFGLAGALVLAAAWTYDPNKARGLDGALKTLRDGPHGQGLLLAAATGLVAFGVYGLGEAAFRRV
ncbi:MAG: DUF1206 domain-containing protein [Actinomycetota bacterium]|nr:DUF1206 domain-containing protein [Actinomycetota bacterium]